ncbi:hypothetical protein EJV47_15195 [Hymenobacter gummosus]|uniref:Uncharacterized protein n=1 Tax=Hymenobacter gummosus TaxID=1776032 RepID=A0A431U1I3_9BACT|nr:hypothetical protein [Hymenobacter gummosus]RTQ48937.1 hypothetical protein EJV47_15195 [Hymenobacter gummosus]
MLALGAVARSGYAQQPAGNRIDGIRTASEVEALMHAADTAGHFSRVTISDTLSIRNRTCKCQARKRGVQPWIKADIDGNGYTDILAVGDANRQEVLLVMALGNDRYDVQRVNYGSKYCFLPTLTMKGGQAVIEAKSYQRKFGGLLGRSRQYRLVYKYAGLVEYNARPDSRRVESVALSYFMSYYGTTKVDLTITESGFAVCREETDGVVKSSVALLAKQEFEALAGLVNYAGVARRRSEYTRSGNHHPHYYLTVVYEGGYKQIDDDGGEGSMGLELLYHRILGLRKSLRWQEVKQ